MMLEQVRGHLLLKNSKGAGSLFLGREFIFASAANNPEQKTRLHREIEAADRQIDQLVYELYGLTEEEIKIVEEAMSQ